MSNRCVKCGLVVRKNSRALIDGCPDCGCLKFVFQPPDRNNSKSTLHSRGTTRNPRAQKASSKSSSKRSMEDPQLANFESIRLVEEGFYIINMKNILAEEPFVLGLEDGRYIIPLNQKPYG